MPAGLSEGGGVWSLYRVNSIILRRTRQSATCNTANARARTIHTPAQLRLCSVGYARPLRLCRLERASRSPWAPATLSRGHCVGKAVQLRCHVSTAHMPQ